MAASLQFNTLLVPVDFSASSLEALERAVGLVANGDNPVIIVLHVLDSALIDFAVSNGLTERDVVISRMREAATADLDECTRTIPDAVEVDAIISEGAPFMEILKKAQDFAVDAVVMSKVGTRGRLEKLLFGTTVEKVVRGSAKPVLVLP